MLARCVFFAVIIGLSWAQSDVPSELPGSITLPPELEKQKEAVGAIEDKYITTVRKRCEKHGGPEAFAKFQSAGNHFGECTQKLINYNDLQKEIDVNKLNGSVDEVFKRYCDKTPQFEECGMNATDAMKICLSQEEQKQLEIVIVVLQELAKFICSKDGDRLALFIADGGPECFQANQEDIKDCANETLNLQNYISDDTTLENEFISFDEESCNKISAFQACAVRALEKCERPTTANIVESLFKYAKKSTPCYNYTLAAQENSAASGLFGTTVTIITAFVAVLFLV